MQAQSRIPALLLPAVLFALLLALPLFANAQTAVASCTFQRDLERGARDSASGGEVVKLQRFLSLQQNVPSADIVTGLFGPKTRATLISYQKSRSITATGIFGPKTRAAAAADCLRRLVPTPTSTSTSASSSCPTVAPPACENGTLSYLGRDARGCSLGYQCANLRFTATSTPVVYLPGESSVAPTEYIATSTIIFTRFPAGTATDRGQFVLGEPSSAYLELDPGKSLCIRVISALDGNKDLCRAVSLNLVYRLEFAVLADSVSLSLNDVKVASVSARPAAPKAAFRVGSQSPDTSGRKGPLIGSLQSVSLTSTSTRPGSVPGNGARSSSSSLACGNVDLPSCQGGTLVPITLSPSGCATGFRCEYPACSRPPIVPSSCSAGQRIELVDGGSCPQRYACTVSASAPPVPVVPAAFDCPVFTVSVPDCASQGLSPEVTFDEHLCRSGYQCVPRQCSGSRVPVPTCPAGTYRTYSAGGDRCVLSYACEALPNQ